MRAIAVTIALSAFLPAACSGSSGGMAGNGKVPIGVPPATGSSERNDAVAAGGSGDGADQPVQVLGTYLTCALDERASTAATVGCNVLRRGDRRRVDLKKSTKSYLWTYVAPAGTAGTVEVMPMGPGDKFHVVYVLNAETETLLAQLIAAVHVVLDAVPLPNQTITSSTHFDADLSQVLLSADDLGAIVAGNTTQQKVPGGNGAIFVPPPSPPAPPAKPAPAPMPEPGKHEMPPTPGATPMPPTPPPTKSPFPDLKTLHYPTSCNSAGNGEYAIKDTFFGDQDGQRTIGRKIYYYADSSCTNLPTRTVKSVPEVTFYYFAGETPAQGALAVSYDPGSTRVSFSIRMESDSFDSKVSFATGF